MRASTPKAVSEPKTPGTGPAFRLPFDNSFFRDMQGFYVPWKPEPSPAPAWVQFNDALALELGLEPATLKSATGLAWLSGVEMPAEAAPLAQAYAGHQFGQFSPHLGDGRALLLGELIDTAGQRRDLALKGSGRTPFSRRGDGKAALGPALREYLMGEAMHALGIPTTRALAVIRTGERVNREGSPPGAILVRVAASHLRVGTFEFFAAREEEVMLRRLLDYAVARHDPALAKLSDKPIPMLEAVCERQAQLIARWMGVGFIHGVMNTDNMSISGETIDYGPCAFMEGFDPATVFSSIDRQGRYAYGQQPAMAQWNLARLPASTAYGRFARWAHPRRPTMCFVTSVRPSPKRMGRSRSTWAAGRSGSRRPSLKSSRPKPTRTRSRGFARPCWLCTRQVTRWWTSARHRTCSRRPDILRVSSAWTMRTICSRARPMRSMRLT